MTFSTSTYFLFISLFIMMYMITLTANYKFWIPAVHCVWDEWIEGSCSATCGIGTRTNTRAKLVHESNGGTCTGYSTETVMCEDQLCPSMYFFLQLVPDESLHALNMLT